MSILIRKGKSHVINQHSTVYTLVTSQVNLTVRAGHMFGIRGYVSVSYLSNILPILSYAPHIIDCLAVKNFDTLKTLRKLESSEVYLLLRKKILINMMRHFI